MRVRGLVGIVLAPLLVLVCPGAARAQPAPAPALPAGTNAPAPSADETTAKRDEARKHFEQALELFDEAAWDAAAVEFLRSRAIFPTRAATKDAAACLRKLHRYDEALDLFEALLREFPNLPAEDRAMAERSIVDLSSLVGKVEVRGGEPGATVLVGGRAYGSLPLLAFRVPVGEHLVRVVKDGYTPFNADVSVTSGETSAVEVRMAPLEHGGRLKVSESAGASARLLVDGVLVGTTPWEGVLAAGVHSVVLDEGADRGTQPVAVTLSADQETTITLTPEELPVSFRVEPMPAAARVTLDGVAVGQGVWDGKLRVGDHVVEVSADGFLPARRAIRLEPHRSSVAAIRLDRDPHAALTFREAEEARQEWLRRRGLTFTYEARAQLVAAYTFTPRSPDASITVSEDPTQGPSTRGYGGYSANEATWGGGIGFGGRIGVAYMLIPDPSQHDWWSAVRLMAGLDGSLGAIEWKGPSLPVTRTTQGTSTHIDMGENGDGLYSLFATSVTLGYQLGVGSFSGREWRGVAFGLGYMPTFFALKPPQVAGYTRVDLAGFELSLDVLRSPLRSTEVSSHLRFFADVLPASGGDVSFLFLGAGSAWY